METDLESLAKQFLFLVHEKIPSRKLTLPVEWKIIRLNTFVELPSWLEGAARSGQRTVILCPESAFPSLLKTAMDKMPQELMSAYGFLVLTTHHSEFVRQHTMREYLDVVSENEFFKDPLFHCLRAVRQLMGSDEKGKRYVSHRTLEHLNQVFVTLSAERNPERLLANIVEQACGLVEADGGILYTVNEREGDLYFQTQTQFRKDVAQVIPFTHKVAENSHCGFCVLTGRIIQIASVHQPKLPATPPYQKLLDFTFDESDFSLISLPMKNSRNEIIAVLQLARAAKSGKMSEFDTADQSVLKSYCTQASVCIENVDLYADIKKLFGGFVKASIAAIESRDPSTGGHSERVALMSVELARATTECDVGVYRSVRFREEEIRELEYAALLHDFGKIGVREEVLVKSKKLYPAQLDAIKDRLKICRAAARIEFLEEKIKGTSHKIIERQYLERLQAFDEYWSIILSANEPSILKKENREILEKIRGEQLCLPDGTNIQVLLDSEYHALSVEQGSLTEEERLEIESHVKHTYQFLKMIPWTRDFRQLTEIAHCHHEKLDGSGYPRSLLSHQIPLQSKIMTIADIYDALTAADRWYKEAVPAERALDILQHEVDKGTIDPVLFDLFVVKKVYLITLPGSISKVA